MVKWDLLSDFLNTVIEQARKGKSLSFMDEMVVPIFSESIWKMVLEIPAFVKLSYAEFEFRLLPPFPQLLLWCDLLRFSQILPNRFHIFKIHSKQRKETQLPKIFS